jgi:hypothetical protein
MELFEKATRNKYRFPYYGSVDVEDLWDIPLEGLDEIYIELNSKVQKANEGLLQKQTNEDKELTNKISIVKHILLTKVEEKENRLKAQARKETEQKILAIIAEKQDEDLKGKSIEDLQKLLDEL